MNIRLIIIIAIALSLVYTNLKFLKMRVYDFTISNEGCTGLCPDRITLYEKKLGKIKKNLPAYGTIGYISNEKDYNVNEKALITYFITQYALSPLVVDNSTNHKLVVGNFYAPIKSTLLINEGLIPVKYFGNGLFLLKKREK